jgi:hypothetical protein
MTPMKNSESPMLLAASEIEPTRISDITPTATPASASIPTDRRTLQGSRPRSSSAASFSPSFAAGLNRSRCVFSEKYSAAT